MKCEEIMQQISGGFVSLTNEYIYRMHTASPKALGLHFKMISN